MEHVFRIHPSIGFARVGNSEEYNLAPETMAALPLPNEGEDTKQNPGTTGGLPLRDDGITLISNRDIRDQQGRLKRQGARFRVFAYEAQAVGPYPNGGGTEVTIGSAIGGKRVRDILWTVHVANKKANCYLLEAPDTVAEYTLLQYQNGLKPPLRNLAIGEWGNDPVRIRMLTIDPGPRAIAGTGCERIPLDKHGAVSYGRGSAVELAPDYPKSFPEDSFPNLYEPSGRIDTLGDLITDDCGRLIVVGAYGRASAWYPDQSSTPYSLNSDVDNDGWFDDTCDGPVNATLIFDDGSTTEVAGAWVVSTDPGYAPQTLNSVSLWDDIYDTWVRELGLEPDLFSNGKFNDDYRPNFGEQVNPIFQSAAVQRWNTNLPALAIRAHDAVGRIAADEDPSRTILSGLRFIRNPNVQSQSLVGAPLMPLSLGDSGQALMSVTKTQYFFLQQWDANHFSGQPSPLGPGEYLDKASLINCLGGRFSPGIDMTFPVRLPGTWETKRAATSHGPFRIRQKPLDYSNLPHEGLPVLSEGYIPYHAEEGGLEPGDNSKFMSLPWHTDYNSCATHPSSPNPTGSSTLYWSWPAQRPVAVNVAADTRSIAEGSQLPGQRWSMRGPGTNSMDYSQVGRYRDREDILSNWWKIGVIIQRTQIEGLENQAAIDELPPGSYLEVESLLADDSAPFVPSWPINAS